MDDDPFRGPAPAGQVSTRESLTAKGYATYPFAPGKYMTMPSCTTVANN